MARWKCRTQKIAWKCHVGTIAQLCLATIFATKVCIDNQKKNLLNSSISFRCSHSMANFGPLTAEIGSGVWGTPANFNGIRVLTSLLQRRRSTEANQALHDVWPSPGLVHYIYIFGGSCPHNGILPGTSKSCVLLYLSLIHIWRCRRIERCRSRWSPYH